MERSVWAVMLRGPKSIRAAVVRCMNVERRALMDMARIGGLLAPQNVTVGGGFQFPTEEEAIRILAELDELPPMKQTA